MASAAISAEVAHRQEKVKILLVDDNPENLIALEATLEGLGEELVKASSGIEALRHLLDDDFAAILLDVRMPDMDGFETATLIRSRKRSRNTPILFLTGYKNEEHLFRGYDLGAVDFLFKPIVPEILQSKVAVFVELSRNSALLKRQAEELRRAEAGMRAVLEAAPEAMIIFEGNHRIRTVNPAAEALFGYPRGELAGEPVTLLSAELASVESGRCTEILCYTASGALFPAEVSISPAGIEGGATVCVIRDITERRRAEEDSRRITLELERQVTERTRELTIDIAERKRAEQRLRESEQRLRVAIDAASLGLWSVDTESAQMHIAPLTAELFGLQPGLDSISLADWRDLIHSEDRSAAILALETACAELSEYESEYRITHRDGSVRWVLSRGQPFAGDDEGPPRVVGVVQDVTQRKLAEEVDRHRHKLESLGILAGGIAHDFNNLLTGILGNASLMMELTDQGSAEYGILGDVVGAAERAAELTRQMLAYSGRGKFVIQPVSVSDEIREILTLLRSSIPRQVELRLELDESVPLVQADKSQLQQLVMNLVINGAEASKPEGGNVRVRSFRTTFYEPTAGFYPAETLSAGEYAVIEVQDDGHGMSEATRNRIFDPFFTTKFTGRGLGLAAALGIVRGHRGGIAVESKLGEGTTFRVYLPGAEVRMRQESPEQRSEPALRGSGTVLVVDDEPVVRGVATQSLARYGYRVMVAEDGTSGLKMFAKHADTIAVVLLDMALPALSGVDVLKGMLAIRPEVQVIASSGFSESEALEKFGHGLAGFLQKPYTVRQLVSKVGSVVKQTAIGPKNLAASREMDGRPG
ncbi:MAG: response regulator [Bryobacteraceae bacterium]